eukprot:361380-Chlamydomonas_euryale.AAC.4
MLQACAVMRRRNSAALPRGSSYINALVDAMVVQLRHDRQSSWGYGSGKYSSTQIYLYSGCQTRAQRSLIPETSIPITGLITISESCTVTVQHDGCSQYHSSGPALKPLYLDSCRLE